jgi:hypothetical protein
MNRPLPQGCAGDVPELCRSCAGDVPPLIRSGTSAEHVRGNPALPAAQLAFILRLLYFVSTIITPKKQYHG